MRIQTMLLVALGVLGGGFDASQRSWASQHELRTESGVPNRQQGTSGETPSLTDKLQESHGVIRPPANIDPQIRVPAPMPDPGTTPVIPPPGTPGGDPMVIPK